MWPVNVNVSVSYNIERFFLVELMFGYALRAKTSQQFIQKLIIYYVLPQGIEKLEREN